MNLKSNMDRFIVVINKCTIECVRHLKSNMDRFIGTHIVPIAVQKWI